MQSFNPNPEHLMTEVYSYPFPEVRDMLRGNRINPEFMLNTITTEEAAPMLAHYQLEPELALPARGDGSLDLDEIHTPVIERLRDRLSLRFPGLDTFNHAYPGHGSSQSIFNILAEWKASGSLQSLAVLDGEYEGYRAYAESLRIPVETYADLTDDPATPGQVWFVSNPSARNGNWLDGEKWKEFVDNGHNIVLDTAYAGLTRTGSLDVNAPNIRAFLTSPSKAFGVFRYRNTGIAFTRDPVSSLYGSRWFKDVPALLDTLRLHESFGPGELPEKYFHVQDFICKRLVSLVEVEVAPSDVLLLGNAPATSNPRFEAFIRAGRFRFGLTKLFEDYEKV